MSVLSFDNAVDSDSHNKLPTMFATKLKTVLMALACVITLLLVDYMLSPSAEQFGESDLLPELPQSFKAKASATLGEQVIAQYNQFEKTEVAEVVEDKQNSTTEQHLSIEQQNKQSGLLRQLYMGNVIYRLSGIVKSTNANNQYKAALSLTYLDTAPERLAIEVNDSNESEQKVDKKDKPYVTLVQGERLNKYVVESVSHKRIVLNDNGRRLWLELFLQSETSEN